MRAWLSLLLLQAADPAAQATALHIHREGLTRITAVEEPLTVLKEFLDVYRQGLCKPVHLFPKSSHAYAEAMKKYGKDKRATQEARRTWEGSRYQRGEAGDAALLLCFAGTDPLDDEFRELALAVYGPILDAMGAGT